MKKLYLSIIAAVAMLTFTACDDFLTTKAPSQLPEEIAYETLDDCDNALNGVYRSMFHYIYNFPAQFDTSSDDIKYTNWGDGSFVSNALFAWHAGTSTFGDANSPWGIHYAQIARVNKLLTEIEKFPEDNTTKRIKGECYMFRAMAHFELVRLYGHKYNKANADKLPGVPYVKKEYDFEVKERASIKSNLADIHRDLTNAAMYMQTRTANAVNYLSIDALYAFQTRVYLYEENYEEVVKAADKLTTYALATTADELKAIWSADLPLSEIIFMIGFTKEEAGDAFSIAEYLYLKDKETQGASSRSNYLPAEELVNLFTANDKRLNIYFKLSNMASGTTGGKPLVVVNKYPGNTNLSTTDKVNQTKHFRYAEVILNKMEALYYLDEVKAQGQLNLFRAKRITDHVNQSLSGDLLLQEIKKERRKEFAFEGMRFHDLRRWNEGFTRTLEEFTPSNHKITVASNDYHWIYPIPQAEMDANNLPASYQNPGYIN